MMATYILIFLVELVVAKIAFYLIRKAMPSSSAIKAAITACLLALIVGGMAGYRITANTALRNFYDAAVREHKQNTGQVLSMDQLIQKLEDYQSTDEFKRLIYVGAAVDSFPPFFILLLVMLHRARKQNTSQAASSAGQQSGG